MDTVRIQVIGPRKTEQLPQHASTESSRRSWTHDAKMIAAIADLYTEALLDLPQVFVTLATEIG